MNAMEPFEGLFGKLADQEMLVVQGRDSPGLPDGTFVFREFYCGEPHCDCRRVTLHVMWVGREETVAALIYAFELTRPPGAGEPRVFLDALGPQSELSETFRAMLERIVATDRQYHEKLVRHYDLWKFATEGRRDQEGAKASLATGAGRRRQTWQGDEGQ